MKKTLLAVSLIFLNGLFLGPSSGQEIKAESDGLMEVQRSQNGWNSKERQSVKTPAGEKKPGVSEPNARHVPVLPGRTPSADSRGRPDLPAVRSTRAQSYMLNRGSSKTRKQAQSRDANLNAGSSVKTTVTTITGPLEIIRNGPTSSKGAGRTGTGAIRVPLGTGRGNEIGAPKNMPSVKQVQKPRPPSQNSSTSSYAASYGAYDPNAKKKRNY
jgi:hypothetical protein